MSERKPSSETSSYAGSAGQLIAPDLTHELVFLAGDIRDIHVVSRGAEIFELLSGEDINSDKMNLGMSVLSSLRGAHLYDFARALFDANETILAKRRALHGIGGGGASIGALEGVVILYRHGQQVPMAIRMVGAMGWENRNKKCSLPVRRRPWLKPTVCRV